ncbi:MAG: hypothetical protein AMXMBFR64_14730 [Myxococcales bacterium]
MAAARGAGAGGASTPPTPAGPRRSGVSDHPRCLQRLRADAVKAGTTARAAQLAASNELKAANKDIANLITRIRSTTRGKYGADSTEWELVGGVRTSERKKKKAKAQD